MTYEEQLDLWVEGKPIHNKKREECCPDFSCCNIDLLAPLDERIAFKNANEDVRLSMLGTFLGRLLERQGHEVITSMDEELINNLKRDRDSNNKRRTQ